ncbi:hypothetical protein ACO0LB_19175 [Undibacterium sp. SXout7W]|uniref:hypothetical protein n=1 Tax=Undibacterium sp. SXout7W TaxID=3413049 RepID=UPI003BF13680
MITIDEIKAMLLSGELSPNNNDIIASGTLVAAGGTSHTYTLHHGWDIAKCLACDELWHSFNLKLMNWISEQKFDPEALKNVLGEIQIDDSHWEWFKKALVFKNGEFHWFFLMIDGQPQAACVIFHPKKSALEEIDVFYIEYIAVAPWNRQNPMESRTFKGIGSLLIRSIISFGVQKLSFNHGFSLHALPRAAEFYVKIGMERISQHDKDTLQYFEMPEKSAVAYAEEK